MSKPWNFTLRNTSLPKSFLPRNIPGIQYALIASYFLKGNYVVICAPAADGWHVITVRGWMLCVVSSCNVVASLLGREALGRRYRIFILLNLVWLMVGM